MNKIGYFIGGSLSRCHDAAILLDKEDPMNTLAESVVQTISTDVMVTLGDIEISLAALLDPDHWSEDWQAVGVEDPDEFVAGLIQADA